ncbi:ATP-dependent RecD-like DNA helicase [Xenophilus sp. Marseille-Q4582]|uniref:ATP-dependent DNA helicase n=1 Tax=Xenophilus sp. Marseille-Q4582 TaxID=2866600 RepID=UPI001CE48CA5|nr:AAA family ATPase [Xenophilus sp. Marseille-Q4582]
MLDAIDHEESIEQSIPAKTSELKLTEGQNKALNQMLSFVIDSQESIFVLRGNSGCGKSTLMKEFVKRYPKFVAAYKLVDPNFKEKDLQLTATTNKAAEALHLLTGNEVLTIHSFLYLRPQKDFKTGEIEMVPSPMSEARDYVVVIDEASFIDWKFLKLILSCMKDCKVIFVGDPEQIVQVNAKDAPVFDGRYKGAELTEVVRQRAADGSSTLHPITELGMAFRDVVVDGDWSRQFPVDGNFVKHLNWDDFSAEVRKEFSRPDWGYKDAKLLAWTNKRVTEFNNAVREIAMGDANISEGDYCTVNSFVKASRGSLKTDELVHVKAVYPDIHQFGVLGRYIELDKGKVFVPYSLEAKKQAIKLAREQERYSDALKMETDWADLRPVYACTINKSQGSTFDKVFIDLSDVARCNNGNTIARLLYVAVTRARHQVFLTGDLA